MTEPCDVSSVLIRRLGFHIVESPDGQWISFVPQLMAYHAAGGGDIPMVLSPQSINGMSRVISIFDDVAAEPVTPILKEPIDETVHLETSLELPVELTEEVEKLEQLSEDMKATLMTVCELAGQRPRTQEAAYRLASQASAALAWLQTRYNDFSNLPEIMLQGRGICRLAGDIKNQVDQGDNNADRNFSGTIQIQDLHTETPVYDAQIGTLVHGFCTISQDETTGRYQIHPTMRLIDEKHSNRIASLYYDDQPHRPMLEMTSKAYFEYDLSKGIDDATLPVLEEIHKRQHAHQLLQGIAEKDADLGQELLAIGGEIIQVRDSGGTGVLDWDRFQGLQAYLPLVEDSKQVGDVVEFLNAVFSEGCLVGIAHYNDRDLVNTHNGILKMIQLNNGQLEIYIEENDAIICVPFCQVLNFVISSPEDEF